MHRNKYYIEIRNRKAEQFMYAHAVDYTIMTKDPDGITVWLYDDTEENRRIVEEFISAQEKRQRMRKHR